MKVPLDELLTHPHIWRGRHAPRGMETLPSGHRLLDVALPGGGWPRAGLIEILAEHRGTGELRLIVPLLRHFSRDDGQGAERGWIAWIRPPYVPYAPALAEAGIDVSRILLVHARDDGEALWATEQALRSAGCEVVLAWADRVSGQALRRLQLAAEENGLPVMLFRPGSALGVPSPAVLRMYLTAGDEAHLSVVKSRGGRPASLPAHDLFGRADV
jgi:protein ImuA